jgi:hypothetical protein
MIEQGTVHSEDLKVATAKETVASRRFPSTF